MRNGDVYKMLRLLDTGSTREEIYQRFRNAYPPEEIDRFLPKKRGRPKKTEVTDDDSNVDQ